MIELLPKEENRGWITSSPSKNRAAFAELVNLAGELGFPALFPLMKINIYFA